MDNSGKSLITIITGSALGIVLAIFLLLFCCCCMCLGFYMVSLGSFAVTPGTTLVR